MNPVRVYSDIPVDKLENTYSNDFSLLESTPYADGESIILDVDMYSTSGAISYIKIEKEIHCSTPTLQPEIYMYSFKGPFTKSMWNYILSDIQPDLESYRVGSGKRWSSSGRMPYCEDYKLIYMIRDDYLCLEKVEPNILHDVLRQECSYSTVRQVFIPESESEFKVEVGVYGDKLYIYQEELSECCGAERSARERVISPHILDGPQSERGKHFLYQLSSELPSGLPDSLLEEILKRQLKTSTILMGICRRETDF
jgi:hypothetical protein